MTAPAPTKPIHKAPSAAAPAANSQGNSGDWVWTWRTIYVGQLAANAYLATSPAQLLIAVGNGASPLLREIPYYGPTIADNVVLGSNIVAATVDPFGFTVGYAVRNGAKWVAEQGMTALEKNEMLSLSGESKEQISTGIALAAGVFLTPVVKSGLESAGKCIGNAASRELAKSPALQGQLAKVLDNRVVQTSSWTVRTVYVHQRALNSWSTNIYTNTRSSIGASYFGVKATAFAVNMGQHPYTPKALALVTAGLSHKNAICIASGTTAFVQEAVQEFQTQLQALQAPIPSPFNDKLVGDIPTAESFLKNLLPPAPISSQLSITHT
jgi:hypothetical protein